MPAEVQAGLVLRSDFLIRRITGTTSVHSYIEATAAAITATISSLTAPTITEQRKIVIGPDKGIVASEGATVTVINGNVTAVSAGNGSIILVKNKTEYSQTKNLVSGDYVVVTEKGKVNFTASQDAVIMVSGRVSFGQSADEDISRIYGKDRYETAFQVADELKAVMGVEKFENIEKTNSDDGCIHDDSNHGICSKTKHPYSCNRRHYRWRWRLINSNKLHCWSDGYRYIA